METKASTRQAFGETLAELYRSGLDVVAVAADTAKSMFTTKLGELDPARAIDVGIAEQNMMMVAAGLASTGKIVFAASYAVFTSMRACEEVRTFIAYPNLNVKIVSGLAGLSGAEEGVTHQSLEDIGIMRSIPNMTAVVPADATAVRAATKAIAAVPGPVYLRLPRNPTPVLFGEDYQFVLGKANLLVDRGTDLTIITNGMGVYRALAAEKLLAKAGIQVRVLEMHTVKPLDREAVVKAARETGAILTVEEHNVIGGLGSAVAEVVTETFLVPVFKLGIPDCFTQSGDHEALLDKYGLNPENIAVTAQTLAAAKKGRRLMAG